VRVHHLNCGSLCPHGGRFLGGEGGLLSRATISCHCLLIEGANGLVLLDTGFGAEEARDPSKLAALHRALGAQVGPAETALAQVEALGFSPGDVSHLVFTHLDPDHAGGLADFPAARVHVLATELDAALRPPLRERARYDGSNWAHGPGWVRHAPGGDEWFGFESGRILPDLDFELLLVPLAGHSRGHTGVAINTGEGWLLHCGDAYFHHGEVQTPPSCPPGLTVFQAISATDSKVRKANAERLRELAARHGEDVELLCSHDPHYLERAQAPVASAAVTG
jgi:glyoxylase-like metal-dependent hydrolase (beta-lactamase superfamily II)